MNKDEMREKLIDMIKGLSDQEIDQVLTANLGPQNVGQSDFDPYEWEEQRDHMCVALVAFVSLPCFLAALDLTEEWRAIETAPRDGTHFLAGQWFVENGKPEFDCAVTWWCQAWGFGGDTRVDQPTHWMPLPKSPPPSTGGE